MMKIRYKDLPGYFDRFVESEIKSLIYFAAKKKNVKSMPMGIFKKLMKMCIIKLYAWILVLKIMLQRESKQEN